MLSRCALALAVLALAALGAPAAPAQSSCSTDVEGTNGADDWTGTDASEYVSGRAGDDRFDGAAGDDCLLGHEGDDTLLGGLGADELLGFDGTDVLDGGPGGDSLSGDTGADSLSGGADGDELVGGDDRDALNGDDGDDVVKSADLRPDRIDCGAGTDQAQVDDLDTVANCEQVARLVFIDARLDLRWRATRRGVTITRAYVTGLTPEARVQVSGRHVPSGFVPVRGRSRTRVRNIERRHRRGQSFGLVVDHRSQPSFEKVFHVDVRRYRNPSHLPNGPFKFEAYCSSLDQEVYGALSSGRCAKVGRLRRHR